MSSSTSGTGPGPSGPGPAVPQWRQIYDILPSAPPGLLDMDIADKLGLHPVNKVQGRLYAMLDEGKVLRGHPEGETRLHYWAVPEADWEATKASSVRARQSLLSRAQRQPLGAQHWLVLELLRPPQRRKDDEELDASVPCPAVVGTGACDCPNLHVHMARHERANKRPEARRARSVLARWQKDRKAWEAEAQEARNAADPRSIYLSDRNYVLNLKETVNFLAARTEDEAERRRVGQGEIPDADLGQWVELLAEVAPALESIAAAVAYVRGDDVIEGDEVDGHHGPRELLANYDDIEDAEVEE